MKSRSLGDIIGPSGVHHHSYTVARGKLALAQLFFTDQHWSLEEKLTVKADWGTAIFIRPPHSQSYIQLTDANDTPEDDTCTDAYHLCISVQQTTAVNAAVAMYVWGLQHDLFHGTTIELANPKQTKLFVYIRGLFRFAIEVTQVKDFRYL